jgi:glycosyltransferase involved in cell wall biosynthesis
VSAPGAPPPSVSATPLVTVVIPTYEREALVQEAIASVLAQGIEEIEIVVVDDGSRDGTIRALERRGGPIVPVSIPHSGRAARVRNAGIRRARGVFVAFLDSDDVWLPGKLRRQLDYFAANPGVAALYTNEYRVTQRRISRRTRFDDFPPRRRVLYRTTVHGLCVQTSSVVLRRHVLDAVGLFDEDQILYEDADMWSRISEQFEWGFLDEPLVLYRPDVDQRPHRLTDERLNLLEAWRYYEKYAARRCRRGADPGEDAGTACFLDGLTAVARAIGEPWPPSPGVLAEARRG